MSQFSPADGLGKAVFDFQNAVLPLVIPSVVTFTYLPFVHPRQHKSNSPSVRWERFATNRPHQREKQGLWRVFLGQEDSGLLTFAELAVNGIGDNE